MWPLAIIQAFRRQLDIICLRYVFRLSFLMKNASPRHLATRTVARPGGEVSAGWLPVELLKHWSRLRAGRPGKDQSGPTRLHDVGPLTDQHPGHHRPIPAPRWPGSDRACRWARPGCGRVRHGPRTTGTACFGRAPPPARDHRPTTRDRRVLVRPASRQGRRYHTSPHTERAGPRWAARGRAFSAGARPTASARRPRRRPSALDVAFPLFARLPRLSCRPRGRRRDAAVPPPQPPSGLALGGGGWHRCRRGGARPRGGSAHHARPRRAGGLPVGWARAAARAARPPRRQVVAPPRRVCWTRRVKRDAPSLVASPLCARAPPPTPPPTDAAAARRVALSMARRW